MTGAIGLPPYVRAQERCVFLAVDGKANKKEVFDEIERAVTGPIAPNLAGVKFNDILHLADAGEQLIKDFVTWFPELVPFIPFIDLKAVDVWDTIMNYMKKYYETYPGLLVTISIHCSMHVFNGMPQEFPEANAAAFCVGTDVTREHCFRKYDMYPEDCAKKWLGVVEEMYQENLVAIEAEGKTLPREHCVSNVISSFDMLDMYREFFPWAGPVVPGVRDHWMLKGNQERTAHSRGAIEKGAQFLVLGGQATRGNKDAGIDPRESQRRTARQIRLGLGTASDDDVAEEAAELNELGIVV